MKRLFDFIVSALLLLILSPLMITIALMSLLALGAPVMFRHPRPGKSGRLFTLHKFRTMSNAVDANGHPLPDEMRVTRYGNFLRRTSMDELPQLLNVLQGDMSFVGPRPLLQSYLPLYTPAQARRHEVRPGITGWAQVNGRNASSWTQRFEYDVWYVDNRTFLLDLRILAMTVRKVVSGEGISEPGHVTMKPFEGNG